MLPWSIGKRDITSDIHKFWLFPVMLVDSDLALQCLKMLAVEIRHKITLSIIAVYVLSGYKVFGKMSG